MAYASPSPTNGENTETLIKYIFNIFSRSSNRTDNAIMNKFLPEILLKSRACQAGTHLDLDVFQGKLDQDQIRFVENVFAHIISINLNTANFDEGEVFFFADKFKMLKEMKISVFGDDKFIFPPNPLNLNSIKIRCMTKNIWLDPVHQILANNIGKLNKFSLSDSYLPGSCIEILHANEIEKLSLESIILFVESDKQRLYDLIRFKRSLKKLKIISNKKVTFQNYFESFTEDLLDIFDRPFEGIEHLCFTLNQKKVLTEFKLNFFPNLKKLSVLYTTEMSFNNIENIIREMNTLRKEGVSVIPIIEFEEYFSQNQTLAFMNSQKMVELQIKSNGYATRIIETSDKYVRVTQLKF